MAWIFLQMGVMDDVQFIFSKYKEQARDFAAKGAPELNKALIELENQMADSSDLKEGERLRLRAYMHEFRLQFLDGYEAGAEMPHLSEPSSGARQGE